MGDALQKMKSFALAQLPGDYLDALWACMVLCHAFMLLASVHWIFNLFSHFRIVGLAGAVVVIALILVIRRKRLRDRMVVRQLAVSAIFVIWNAAVLAPYLPRSGPKDCTLPGRQGEVLVMSINPAIPNILNFVEALPQSIPDQVDALVLTELGPIGVAALNERLKDRFPYQENAQAAESIFGVAILSRYPILSRQMHMPRGAIYPVAEARLETPAGELTVLGLHPPPPTAGAFARQHRLIMGNAALAADSVEGPLVVAGDFNATPFGHQFKQMTEHAGLLDPRLEHGYLPSWPSFRDWPTIMPIDHILTRQADVTCLQTAVVDGSDHHAMLARLRLTSASPIQTAD
ncbi:MAG: endonuclease/exonuclease/phosphatase family protein [Alphaproteobacteria bacterium]